MIYSQKPRKSRKLKTLEEELANLRAELTQTRLLLAEAERLGDAKKTAGLRALIKKLLVRVVAVVSAIAALIDVVNNWPEIGEAARRVIEAIGRMHLMAANPSAFDLRRIEAALEKLTQGLARIPD